VPLDTPAATRRFFHALQPDIGILMETETWPNLLRQARAVGMPLVLANARLSERSLRKGQRWSALTQPMMESLALVLAQTEEDALRFQEAGVPRHRLQVMGNLKFDLQPRRDLLEQGRRWREAVHRVVTQRRLVLAASWREGEDAALLKAWCSEADAARNAGLPPAQRPLLIVVPRHPQRFDEVHAALRSVGLSVSRRSNWGPDGPADQDARADAWLGDSMGEMVAYYALADVALLGGSFAPLGGQNLIEAAACACPVIAGPHTFNFEEAAQRAIEEGAARRASDLPAAVQLALALPADQLDAHRQAAARFCSRHAGSALRQAQAIMAVRDQPPNSGDSA
jgi:3-deoxy-D-manno-octulosonic-acid transferase